MKVTFNEKEYHGLFGVLIAIPSMVMIGLILMAIGAALAWPLWLLMFLARAFS